MMMAMMLLQWADDDSEVYSYTDRMIYDIIARLTNDQWAVVSETVWPRSENRPCFLVED